MTDKLPEASPCSSQSRPELPQSEGTLHERVRDVIADLAPVKDVEILESTRLIVDLGFDSLGLLELVAVLEHEFNLSPIDEQDIVDIKMVGEVEKELEKIVSHALAMTDKALGSTSHSARLSSK